MAQWEICCAALVKWRAGSYGDFDHKIVLYYYTPTGVITKFPSINSWGQVLAILGAAEWEAIAMQHGLDITVVSTGHLAGYSGESGNIRMPYRVDHPSGDLNRVDHPSGDLNWSDLNWHYVGCDTLAYFKRPIQAGRKIDDAL